MNTIYLIIGIGFLLSILWFGCRFSFAIGESEIELHSKPIKRFFNQTKSDQ